MDEVERSRSREAPWLRAAASSPAGRLRVALAYAAVGALVGLALVATGVRREAPGPARDALLLLVKGALAVGLAAWIVRRATPDEPLARTLGLVPARPSRGLAYALLGGLAYLAVIAGLASLQPGGLHAPAAPRILPAMLAVGHVVVEEIGARGFLLGWLAKGRPFFRANALTSLVFVGMHWSVWIAAGAGWMIVPMSVVLLVLSLVLGWATRASGSIWVGVLVHLANNALASG